MNAAETSQPRGTKAQKTRERIRDAALALFAEGSYETTTLREIARKAGCSLGLTYRYFKSKDEFVLLLYKQVSAEFNESVNRLGPGTMGQRFRASVEEKLRILGPHRGVLGSAAVYSAALQPDAPVAVLGRATRALRAQSLQAMTQLAIGSSNRPAKLQDEQLGMVLYAGLLLLLLFWFNDPTHEQQATHKMADLGATVLDVLPMALKIPGAQHHLRAAYEALLPVFGDHGAEAEPTGVNGEIPGQS